MATTELGYETATRSRNIQSLAAGMMIATRDFVYRGERFLAGVSRVACRHEMLRDPQVRAKFDAADRRQGRALEHRGAHGRGPSWRLGKSEGGGPPAWEIRSGEHERR